MRLGDLLDAPDLGLRLAHDPGAARAIEVDRVFTTDQPDPSRYLFGGELVLSGLIFHSGTPQESEVFVAALARSKVVAFGVGEERFGCVPDHIVEACRRHEVPVFGVPENVSFSRVTDHIVARFASDRTAQLTASLSRQRRLLDSVASGRALDEMAVELVTTTGIACWVITATGRQVVAVAGGGRTLREQTIDELTEEALRGRVLPISVGELTLVRIGARPVRRAGGWLLVIGRHLTELPPHVLAAFEEFAAICALVRAREHDTRAAADRFGDRLADLLHQDAGPDAVAEALAEAGLRSTSGWFVLSAATDDRTDQHPLIRAALRDSLLQVGHGVVGEVPGAEVIAVVDAAVGAENLERTIRSHLHRLTPVLAGPLQVGISDPAGQGRLAGALALARQARSLPRRVEPGGPEESAPLVRVVGSAPLASAPAMLALVPDAVRRTFADLVLGPLIDGDDRTGADLLDTLSAFLAENGSWSRTATRLHVHINTVRYRISRIEALTGRDLSTTADRADMFLALTVAGPRRS